MTLAAEWQGQVGDAWAEQWQRTDRSFSELAPLLDAAIAAAAPETGRTIDIGCGAGATSLALAAARPNLAIVGIDLSAALIETARQRASTLANLSFEVAPAQQAATAYAPIDFYCSRHGVMFFDDPVAAFTALRQAAAPAASLVFSCFRAPSLNPWAGEVAVAILGSHPPRPEGYVPGPFAFADPDFVDAILRNAGWVPDEPEAIDFRFVTGGGKSPIDDAMAYFQQIGPAAPALRAASDADRPAMLDRLRAVVADHAHDDVVDFPAAAWIWTARNQGGSR